MQSCEYTLHVKCLWPNFNLMLINNKGDIIPDLQAFEKSSLDEFFFFFFSPWIECIISELLFL